MTAKKRSHVYDFPRPAVTVDIVLITRETAPRVLLIRRKRAPFAGCWAFPGGFVDEGETLEDAARRELLEETGLSVKGLKQLGTFGDPGRDPRGWTISIAFLGRVEAGALRPQAADDAAAVAWHPLASLPPLAFDHGEILTAARRRCRIRA